MFLMGLLQTCVHEQCPGERALSLSDSYTESLGFSTVAVSDQ